MPFYILPQASPEKHWMWAAHGAILFQVSVENDWGEWHATPAPPAQCSTRVGQRPLQLRLAKMPRKRTVSSRYLFEWESTFELIHLIHVRGTLDGIEFERRTSSMKTCQLSLSAFLMSGQSCLV